MVCSDLICRSHDIALETNLPELEPRFGPVAIYNDESFTTDHPTSGRGTPELSTMRWESVSDAGKPRRVPGQGKRSDRTTL